MTMSRLWKIALLTVTGAFGLMGAAQSTEIFGTDFNVIYDPSTLGLFGTLSLVGNTLEFTPNNFKALSTNGQGVTTPTGGATTASDIQLVANPGFQFGGLQLTEFGDYLLQGTGSSVSLSGELIAFDGDATGNPIATYTTGTITPNPSLPLNLNTGTSQNWSGSAAITNATSPVGGGGAWLSGATTIDLSIENLLSASTVAANSEALIEKKAAFGGVGLTVTPVPVPPSVWLLAPGVLGLSWVACRSGHARRGVGRSAHG
jgi:hypothetical protein